MSEWRIRRGQLITPFGTGAMTVTADGTSVIVGGLDHWFSAEQLGDKDVVHDWRLEARLHVQEFRLPPVPPEEGRGRDDSWTVPVFRFPRWSFCAYCKRMELLPLTLEGDHRCSDPTHDKNEKRRPKMYQVPFVAICERGHISDFPFREWVHRSVTTHCKGVLRLRSRGGGGLEGQVVECEGCKAKRRLSGILTAFPVEDGYTELKTFLTERLDGNGEKYLCQGQKPWVGVEFTDCGVSVRGALRAAGNVYFPKVESSIYLPKQMGLVSESTRKLMEHPAVSVLIDFMGDTGISVDQFRTFVEKQAPGLLNGVSDEELAAALDEYAGHGAATNGQDEVSDSDDLSDVVDWRYPEFEQVRGEPRDDALRGRDPGLSPLMRPFFSRVRAVEVLRETRVLRGFSRINDQNMTLTQGKELMWREPGHLRDWLPATVVAGEGIYLEFADDRLLEWESREAVQGRAKRLQEVMQPGAFRSSIVTETSPRFLLAHTVAHLLINQLVYDCGYGSASLRERLYVSSDGKRPMAGILIYTAAGDSEGTMGGLVRMARPDLLERVLGNALTNARWCSTDPICMELGQHGQGPGSTNLAACHACCLIPETSCECTNSTLDRGVVVGDFTTDGLAYFEDFLT